MASEKSGRSTDRDAPAITTDYLASLDDQRAAPPYPMPAIDPQAAGSPDHATGNPVGPLDSSRHHDADPIGVTPADTPAEGAPNSDDDLDRLTGAEADASRLNFERRVLQSALLTSAPIVALALLLVLRQESSDLTRWTLIGFLIASWLTGAFLLRERVVRPIQTLSNLLGALREGDFSIRSRGARTDDALGLALVEINTLSETLREQRMGAQEATALLRNVMAEIDVVVLAFDPDGRLRLVNRAGERVLGQPAQRMLGRRAEDFNLESCLTGESPRTITAAFPGGSGRWELRRTSFIQGGKPHQLLVLSDLSRALSEEERQAWQRLIRVVGHEINNSLTPIQSIAGSLIDLLRQDPPPPDRMEDLRQGLSVVQSRSAALSRFLASYARLTRLPPPEKKPLDVEGWVRRVVALEDRLPVAVRAGPHMTIAADGDQLDQLLINLLRNAVDAALQTGGNVEITWANRRGSLELHVLDGGPGLPPSANLFVPFFTTKPGGSGIGLALSRQIAEGHGGRLVLENRTDRSGCRATLVIPA